MIEVSGVSKAFRIPTHKVNSLKERAVHPLTRMEYRSLEVLRDVSFEVGQGEFFGIVGRNGSGKSTLLKILASIYSADGGQVRMGGRLAPFIELGVGFNPELAARDNVILNGVMMGLTRREAVRRVDAVLDFSELGEFAELKLKNYSSGMTVRLAFSVMLESDADILLIDEVLAVGDAGFAQKCADAFAEMRGKRTVVLVTHDMNAVQTYCDRAMLLHDGSQQLTGDPEGVARRYLQLNFESGLDGGHAAVAGDAETWIPDIHARVVEAELEGAGGTPELPSLEVGKPLRLSVVVEAREEMLNPVFEFRCRNAEGVDLFGFESALDPGRSDGGEATLASGQRVRISGEIENPLAQGHYYVTCMVTREHGPGALAMQSLPVLNFVVYGTEPARGLVNVDARVSAVIEESR